MMIHSTDKSNREKIALTFDVEWWGRAYMDNEIPRHHNLIDDERVLHMIMDVLSLHNVKATFFVVADDFDGNVLKRIVDEGHEVASHSKTHSHFGMISEKDWEEEIHRSKSILEDRTGEQIFGFRTPFWSVPFSGSKRFADLLIESGYHYDSSFCSFKTHLYGDARYPRKPVVLGNGLIEIPLPRIGVPPLPWVGGFYFRVIPLALMKWFVSRYQPAFLYFHPWDLYMPNGKNSGVSLNNIILTYGKKRSFNKFQTLVEFLTKRFQVVSMNEIAQLIGTKQKA